MLSADVFPTQAPRSTRIFFNLSIELIFFASIEIGIYDVETSWKMIARVKSAQNESSEEQKNDRGVCRYLEANAITVFAKLQIILELGIMGKLLIYDSPSIVKYWLWIN